MKMAIVAVGYSRPDSMQRLLGTVRKAEYGSDEIDLIISIDKGKRQEEVIKVAEKLDWPYGEKKIRAFSKRQGLRKHIIQCGDLTEKYDAVVVLEDDLMVSCSFYTYVKQCIEFYGEDSRIAGISLYKHEMHPGVYRPFEPVNNGYDVFLMQFAMSWGQCWTKQMWEKFKQWYIQNENTDLRDGNILPRYIAQWNKQSWLKYYMRYIVETNRYFVYPYIALSTNASDVGEHCGIANNDYQISVLQGTMKYRFPEFEAAVKYDVYFERQFDEKIKLLGLKGKVLLDLYADRYDYLNADYLISTKCLPFKIVKEFQLKYRPMEMNCLYPAEGKGIRMYDLAISSSCEKVNLNYITRYDVRSIHWKRLLKLGWEEFLEAIKIRLVKHKS